MNHQAAEVPQACKTGNVMWKLRVSGAEYKQLSIIRNTTLVMFWLRSFHFYSVIRLLWHAAKYGLFGLFGYRPVGSFGKKKVELKDVQI